MTIVVVTIVAIPVSLFLSQHIQSTFQSEDLTIARQLARFEMAKVNNMDYDSIDDASFSNYEGYDYNLIRRVSFVYPSIVAKETLKKIIVEVTKPGAASAVSPDVLVRLVTYIASNVSYGL